MAISVSLLAGWAEGSVQPGVVVAWGDNSYGQVTLPAGMTNVTAIAGGGFHSLALTADGAVVAWGSNSNGQTNVPANLTNVIGLAAGAYHSLALKVDGTVVAWGAGSKGETNVPAALTNAIAIAAGYSHSLALTASGKVIAWGLGSSGQTNVPANLTNVVAVACGAYHSLALKADGTVVAWGDNSFNQAIIPPGLTNIVGIGGGFYHSLVLNAGGTIVGWGDSSYGQTNVPPDLTNAIKIAVGAYDDLALRADGTVTAWGYNSSGQTNTPAGLATVAAIAAGFSHNLVITLHPSLAAKPPSDLELTNGATASLQVTVLSGLPVQYQWSFDGVAIAGATGTGLTIDAFALAQAGLYSVTVSNQYGNVSTATAVRLTNSPIILVDGVDVGGGTVSRVGSAQVTMSSSLPAANIYYTLDGSAPDFLAFPYTTNAVVLTNSATIRAISYDAAYSTSAESAPVTVQISPTYVLAAGTLGGGTVTVSPPPDGAGGGYISNDIVTLTATPASGWSFLNWSGDASGTSNLLNVVMDRPRSIEAVFATDLSLLTNGNGQIVLDPPSGPYPFDTAIEIAAVPAPGSYFFGWAGSLSGSLNPMFVYVTSSAGVTALFGALQSNQVSLTVLPDSGGTVTVTPPAQPYTNGATVTLTALPAPNFVFTGWGGDAAGVSNPLVLTLDSSKLIRASFASGASTNPPAITQQPVSRTVTPGTSTLLSVQVAGDGPFAYQWQFNGSALPGATSSAWLLSDLTPAQAGLYDVVVTNSFGALTSSVASVALFGLELVSSETQPLPLLTLDAAPASAFDLEFSPDLSQTNWLLLSTVQVQAHRFYYVDLPSTNSPARFYRAVPR